MTRLILTVSMSAFSALLLTGCPPDPNAPPAVPVVGWTVRDVTTASDIVVSEPIPGQYTATVVGQHQLSVSFNAHSASGVGSMNTNGTISNVQCGYTTVANGEPPPAVPIILVHPFGHTVSRQLDVEDYNANSTTVQTSASLEYVFNLPVVPTPGYAPQICPKTYRAGPGVTVGGSIIFAGGATNWRDSSLQASSVLSITVTSGVFH
jgi:hypothetical protein